MHCELVAPGLFAAPAAARLPSLELLLARGRCTSAGSQSLETWLHDAFELETPLAAGALTLLGAGGEPGTQFWLRADPVVLVWALAATEVVSALSHKRREDGLSARTFATAKRRLAKLESAWSEVSHYDAVRAKARRLLEVHALSAADALHLAAALIAVEDRTSDVGFVSFDRRLNEAAEKEGFQVLPEP